MLALSVALAGCGYVGDPQPPALEIPVPVSDLRAFEYGDQIVVAFTLPALTTEGLPLTKILEAQLEVGGRSFAVPDPKPGPVEQDIPVSDFAGQSVEIRVRATGPKGRQSEWSNVAALEVIPPLATPFDVRAENVARGVALRWQGAGPKYRVFRVTEDAEPQPLGETGKPEYVDESTVYGVPYRYLVQALVSESQQGRLSGDVAITPDDVFPPAVPAGVTGLAATESIELAWERNTENDFAGYHVYRAVETGVFERAASGLSAPSFSDARIEVGKRYRYAVSAVDLKGNESARSPEVEVVAQ
jgi:hypothetical protein